MAASWLLILAGCRAPAPLPESVAQLPPQPEPSVPVHDEEAVGALLGAAERALDDNRLLTPEDDSAYLYYSQALAIAPDRADIREGFERIVERYLALAQQAVDRQRWAAARAMLDRAAVVNSAHPGIPSLRRQVDLLASARRLTLDLGKEAVHKRHATTAAKLTAFGKQARRTNARVTIRCGSDADGRWIYRQLNNAPGEKRIRGGIEIGLPPRVTILLLPAEDGDLRQGAK